MSTMNDLDKIRFPAGDFVIDPEVTREKRKQWIEQMAEMPAKLRTAPAGLNEEQINTRYRKGGWTLRQVVHHLADAHLNGFTRFKLALTEEQPLIKTYEENLWAETSDGRDAQVELSLKLLEALHERWIILLESLSENDFIKAFSHPERGLMTIDKSIQLYAWHGIHHTTHITELRKRMSW